MESTPYLIGRLVAGLIHYGIVDDAEGTYSKVQNNPSWAITQAAQTDNLSSIIEAIDDIPEKLTPEEASEYALGYYHQMADCRSGHEPSPDRKQAGRPALPPGVKGRRVFIPLTDEEYSSVKELSTEERRSKILKETV